MARRGGLLEGAVILIVAGIFCVLSSGVAAQRIFRRVFVAVSDRGGVPILDLTAADFTLMERGTKREVTRVARGTEPMRIVVISDSSSAVAAHLTHVRGGLNAFLDALIGAPELALISTGGQLRVRVAPTADRQRMKAAAAGFAHDGGGNAFVDTLLEAHERFFKPAPTRWPVFVMLLTDSGEAITQMPVEQFNRFVDDFLARGGNAHAIILKGRATGIVSDFAQNLTENAGGTFEVMNTGNSLPEKMTALARRINGDHYAMANRWEVEYATAVDPPDMPAGSVDVRVGREDARVQVSPRRPF
jgi:hypothetical protein